MGTLSRILVALGLLAAASRATATPNVTLSQNAASVGRYDIYELTMTNPATYANPWEAVNIAVTFTAPSAKTYAVGGFSYDGQNTWKVRFAPMEVGAWTWSLSYDDGSGIYAQTGGFSCVPSSHPGFLRIHPSNPVRFETEADGKVFYPLGFNAPFSTTNLATPISPTGAYSPLVPAADFFQTFSNAGMNFYRDNAGSPVPIGYGGNFNVKGSGENDYDATQSAYMDNIAMAVHAAGWKFMLAFWSQPFLHNFDLSSAPVLQATEHLHQYMINRYGAYVDIWELMNEGFPTQAYMDTVTAYVRANDPYVHLITLSYPAANQSDLDIVSPHFYLSSTNATVDMDVASKTAGYASFNQPVLYGEAGEGGPSGMYDPDRFRAWIWTTFFTEAAPVFWFNSVHHHLSTGTGIVNQYIGSEERAEAKILTDLITGFDAAATTASVTVTPAGQVRAYALVSPVQAGAYLVHAHNQTALLSGATLKLTLPAAMDGVWVDPKTGQQLQTLSVPSGSQTLAVPPFRNDIALWLAPGAAQLSQLRFAPAAYSAPNNQASVSLTVARLGPSGAAVIVDYATSDGQAKAGTSYVATSGTLSWAANDLTSQTIVVSLIPQSTMTGDLDFLVSLSNPTGAASVGGAGSAQVHLLNTVIDAAVMDAPLFTVAKGATTLPATVDRVGNGSGPWGVYYDTRPAGGSALAGTDYTAIPPHTIQVTWDASDAAPKTFDVQLLPNGDAGTRWFEVELGAGCSPDGPTRATAVIVDAATPSGGVLNFSGSPTLIACLYGEATAQVPAPAASSSVQLHVSRTQGSTGAVSVQYATNLSGTAEAGLDYTGASGTLNWADGDSADKIISVPILSNPTAAGTRWFAVELSKVTGAILALPQLAEVDIGGQYPAPTLGSVVPTSGPVGGGTSVSLTGTGFLAGISVQFGSVTASSVTVQSAGAIDCISPAGALGPVAVTVTNPDGQSASLPGAFTYVAGGSGTTQGTGGGTSTGTAGASTSGGAGTGTSGGGTSGETSGASSTGPHLSHPTEISGGCGCGVAPSSGLSWILLALLARLGRRRPRA